MKRIASILIAVAMLTVCVVGVATNVFAEDTYAKVTSADEVTTGKYVLVAGGYALGTYSSGWVLATELTAGDSVTAPDASLVWDVTVNGDGTVKLTDSNGVTVAPKSGNTNGIQEGDYAWTFTFADGTATFTGTGDDTTTLASNSTQQNKFRAYKNTTVTGQYADQYPCNFTMYKLGEGAPVVDDSSDASSDATSSDATSSDESSADTSSTTTPATGSTYTAVTTLNNGDKVVVYNPANGVAMSQEDLSEEQPLYRKGVEVTVADGKVTTDNANIVWTVNVTEAGVEFVSADGKKLSCTGRKLFLGEEDTVWTVSAAATEGCVYIASTTGKGNSGDPYTIEWYAQYSEFSTYFYGENSEGLFAMQLFALEGTSSDDSSEPTSSDAASSETSSTGTDEPVAGDAGVIAIVALALVAAFGSAVVVKNRR